MIDCNEISAMEYFKKKRKIMDSLGRTDGICEGVDCGRCPFYEYDCENLEITTPELAIKAIMDYKDNDTIDWSKIPVDTKILVRDKIGQEWVKRYFAKYENGKVYSFSYGADSFSINNKNNIVDWEYAKLFEGDEKE